MKQVKLLEVLWMGREGVEGSAFVREMLMKSNYKRF